VVRVLTQGHLRKPCFLVSHQFLKMLRAPGAFIFQFW
jgi:hypothetical protein